MLATPSNHLCVVGNRLAQSNRYNKAHTANKTQTNPNQRVRVSSVWPGPTQTHVKSYKIFTYY